MTTAREIMTEGVECAKLDDSLVSIAARMRDGDIGAMPICGDDERLVGMITDRDIVVQFIAEGADPSLLTAANFATGTPVVVEADANLEEIERLMSEHQVRRLPVVDDGRLVGMVSQGDLSVGAPIEEAGDTVRDISQ